MSNPIVSVIMPVRNMERYLADSIESIRGQQFRDFELIVVDFGSTDRSIEIATRLASLDERLKLVKIAPCGLAEARNAGAAHAQGRYLAVQDADDLSLPERLQLQIDYLDKHPEIGMLGGSSEWIDGEGNKLWVSHLPSDEETIKAALVDHYPFCHTSIVIRTQAFVEVGGYRPVMTQSHDYDLALRLVERHRCTSIPQIVVQYRLHPYQVSLSRRRKQSYCKLAAQVSASARRSQKPDPLDGVDEISPALLNSMGIGEGQIQRELASGYKDWIGHLINAGDYPSALNVAKEALRVRWNRLEPSRTAQLYLLAAQLYWKEKKFVHGLFVALRIIFNYPPMAMRFAKALGRRLGAIQQRSA